MKRLVRLLVVCLIGFVAAGCHAYPERLLFEGQSAFPGVWPIIFGEIVVNGQPIPVLGNGQADIVMPDPLNGENLSLTVRWVEYHSGKSWEIDLDVPLSPAERRLSSLSVLVSVGRGGAIAVSTSATSATEQGGGDPVCADSTPQNDARFAETIRYFSSLENWPSPGNVGAPLPPSPCISD